MLRPALLYFAISFAVGFLLGAIRILVVAPRIGEVAAVMIECPFMLAASFLVARWVIHHLAPTAGASRRLAIGMIAFAVLILAEMTLSAFRGIMPGQFAKSLLSPAGSIGLACQGAFALMPLCIRPNLRR